MDADVQNLMGYQKNLRKIQYEVDKKLEAFKDVDENVNKMNREILQLQENNNVGMEQLNKQESLCQRTLNNLNQKKDGLQE